MASSIRVTAEFSACADRCGAQARQIVDGNWLPLIAMRRGSFAVSTIRPAYSLKDDCGSHLVHVIDHVAVLPR